MITERDLRILADLKIARNELLQERLQYRIDELEDQNEEILDQLGSDIFRLYEHQNS